MVASLVLLSSEDALRRLQEHRSSSAMVVADAHGKIGDLMLIVRGVGTLPPFFSDTDFFRGLSLARKKRRFGAMDADLVLFICRSRILCGC